MFTLKGGGDGIVLSLRRAGSGVHVIYEVEGTDFVHLRQQGAGGRSGCSVGHQYDACLEVINQKLYSRTCLMQLL